MPKYALYLHGVRNDPNKIFGWTGPELNSNVYLVGGPYKMVSLFMRVLLTPKGEVIGRPNEGTEFYDLITGNIQDSTELQERMVQILDDAFSQTQEIQQKTSLSGQLEEDEILVAYSIEEFYTSTSGDIARIKVELENAAGTRVSGLIPLTSFQR